MSVPCRTMIVCWGLEDAVGHFAWEGVVELAETETDIDKLRKCVEQAESVMFRRASERASSNDGQVEGESSGRAADRLFRVKNEWLKWPNPFSR